MKARSLIPVVVAVPIVLAGGLWLSRKPAIAQPLPEPVPLPTGVFLSPIGEPTLVGDFPTNMALSPDGRWVAVTTSGREQRLTILNASTGAIAAERAFDGELADKDNRRDSLYFGLDWHQADGGLHLAVSQGAVDRALLFRIGADGSLAEQEATLENDPENGSDTFRYDMAGLVLADEGQTLFALNNHTSHFTDYRGSLSRLDVASGERTGVLDLPGFPLEVVAAGDKLYVSCERDRQVAVVDAADLRVRRTIPVGENPGYMTLNKAQTRLFVSNSTGDTISVIDTTRDVVVDTWLIRPDAARGLAGVTPLGTALSLDEKTLYVACADLNAVAAVEVETGIITAMMPTGWYPTDVVVTPENKLFVASAKGILARNPSERRHPLSILPGIVLVTDLDEKMDLDALTAMVIENNRYGELETAPTPESYNPGIEHVIYIIKENRTYDQVLGDLPQGNGDPSLLMFGRDVTPNQHALVERFVLLDNFYVCAEVSADGWNWSTAGIASSYNQRNMNYNYSGRRARTYDFEGQNYGTPADVVGLPDVNRPAGGYLWDLALDGGKSLRNYGMFVAFGNPALVDEEGEPIAVENAPNKKALQGVTDPNFRRYDLAYPDSPLAQEYGVTSPNQLAEYGEFGAKSRFEAWEREFDAYVRSGEMPHLSLVRLGNDHTNGTRAGSYSPRAMVADNDYAVGLIVEKVSKSPFWNKTAIVILEDDAQNGFDHVDCHRSTVYVVSPYIAPGQVDSRFYNTDSALRTIELLLGLPPMHHFDAVATPFGCFGDRPVNSAPFEAIRPAQEIACEINPETAYRSADSAALINPLQEESLPDEELNDILWGAIMGADTPRPPVRRNVRWAVEED